MGSRHHWGITSTRGVAGTVCTASSTAFSVPRASRKPGERLRIYLKRKERWTVGRADGSRGQNIAAIASTFVAKELGTYSGIHFEKTDGGGFVIGISFVFDGVDNQLRLCQENSSSVAEVLVLEENKLILKITIEGFNTFLGDEVGDLPEEAFVPSPKVNQVSVLLTPSELCQLIEIWWIYCTDLANNANSRFIV